MTVLMYTVQKRHPEFFRMIMEYNPDVTRQDNNGMTALMHAVQRGNVFAIGVLLRKDAPLVFNVKDRHGKTALHWAIDTGNPSIVSTLLSLEEGSPNRYLRPIVDLNIQDADGRTVVMRAMHNEGRKSLEIIEMLLSLDLPIRLHLQDSSGMNAMMLAAANRLRDNRLELLVGLLSDHEWVNVLDRKGNTAITHAVQSQDFRKIYLLLQKGALLGLVPGQQNGFTPLICSLSDVRVMAYLLDEASPDAVNAQIPSNGYTMLMTAVYERKRWEIIEHIIDAGADVNLHSRDGETALSIACLFHHAVVRGLIDKGARRGRPEGLHIAAKTPLMVACQQMRADDVVLTLLTYGTDGKRDGDDVQINAQDAQGETALMKAVSTKNLDRTGLLLHHGAVGGINLRNLNGYTALILAIHGQHVPLIHLLLDAGAVHGQLPEEGVFRTALMEAVAVGNMELVEFFFDRSGGDDAIVNAQDEEGRTALMCAIHKGDLTLVHWLMDRIADERINLWNNNGETAFALAMLSEYFVDDRLDLYERFMTKGAVIGLAPGLGRGLTTIMAVVIMFHPDGMLERLIEHATPHDLNAQNHFGITALMLGPGECPLEVCELLMSRGNREMMNIEDDSKVTALGIATRRRDTDWFHRLLEMGARIGPAPGSLVSRTPLMEAIDTPGNPLLDVILQKMLNEPEVDFGINAVDDYGRTALALAASRGLGDLCAFLLEHGAHESINVRDKFGNTALTRAIETENPDNVHLFLEFGAHQGLQPGEERGTTPIMAAINYAQPDILRHLIDRGGHDTLYIQDRKGFTALMHAARKSNSLYTRLVLEAEGSIKSEAMKSMEMTDDKGLTALHMAVLIGNVDNVGLLLRAGADIHARDHEGRTAWDKANPNNHPMMRLLETHRALYTLEYEYSTKHREQMVRDERVGSGVVSQIRRGSLDRESWIRLRQMMGERPDGV